MVAFRTEPVHLLQSYVDGLIPVASHLTESYVSDIDLLIKGLQEDKVPEVFVFQFQPVSVDSG